MKAVYFIGIGGTGMQPLAYFAKAKGLRVGGSDSALSLKQKEAFQKQNIALHNQAQTEHLKDYDTIVYSSAISEEHPQRSYAAKQSSLENIGLLHRMDFLNLCMQECSQSFAVAGTHGKSSSTAMLAWLLLECGLDPHVILGARPLFLEQSFHLGSGQLGLYESDESDGSFLKSQANLRLLLNIDEDHLEHYGTMRKLTEAFHNFCEGAKLLALNLNDPILEKISHVPQIACRSVFFSCWQNIGQMQEYLARSASKPKALAHYTAYFIDEMDASLELFVRRDYKYPLPLGRLKLKLAGSHFARNALGVLALALEAQKQSFIKLADTSTPRPAVTSRFVKIMNAFPGLERRLERIGSFQGAPIYDDYAHHPTEIRAALQALRGILAVKGRIIALFQAHRYSRTASLYASLAEALELAEEVFLLPLYAAGEKALDGVSAELIYNAMRQSQTHCHLIGEEDLGTIFLKVHPEDIIVALGAGSVSQLLRQSLGVRKGFIPISEV